ncbi:MAG: WD40 repeat domain-containing protein [Bacteroidota bacterium]
MKRTILYLILLAPIWSLAQTAQLKVNLGHTAPIRSLRFSPDSRYLVSSSDDGTMKLWDVQKGKLLKTSPAVSNSPFNRKLFFFPEQQLVSYFTGSEPGNWYNWTWELGANTLKDGRSMSARVIESRPMLPGLSPSEPKRDYQDELWEKSGVEFQNNSAEPLYFTNGVGYQHRGFFPNGQHLYRRSGDTLYYAGIWEEQNFRPSVYPGLTDIFSFNSSASLIFGGANGPASPQVTMWNVQTGEVFTQGNLPAGQYLNDVSPDGKHLLLTDAQGASYLYDLSKNQNKLITKDLIPTSLSSSNDPRIICFNQAQFSPNGQWIARGGTDGAIYARRAEAQSAPFLA